MNIEINIIDNGGKLHRSHALTHIDYYFYAA